MNVSMWQQALELLAADVVADVNRYPDECGVDRLVRVDFHDLSGDYMIAGEEPDFGYTYTMYDGDGEDFTTDGGPDLVTFSDHVRRIAARA
jgi:hypothetical protein